MSVGSHPMSPFHGKLWKLLSTDKKESNWCRLNKQMAGDVFVLCVFNVEIWASESKQKVDATKKWGSWCDAKWHHQNKLVFPFVWRLYQHSLKQWFHSVYYCLSTILATTCDVCPIKWKSILAYHVNFMSIWPQWKRAISGWIVYFWWFGAPKWHIAVKYTPVCVRNSVWKWGTMSSDNVWW